MKDNMEMSQESRLLILLFQAQHLAFETVESEFWHDGISTQQALALFIIQSLGGSTTPSELSKRLLRRPNSISAILNRMEKSGFVKLGSDPSRKGVMRATITDKGKQAFDNAWRKLNEYSNTVTSTLSAEAKQRLSLDLETLRDRVLQEASSKIVPFP